MFIDSIEKYGKMRKHRKMCIFDDDDDDGDDDGDDDDDDAYDYDDDDDDDERRLKKALPWLGPDVRCS